VRIFAIDGRGGPKSAAEVVDFGRFTVLLGGIVLFAILFEAMFSRMRLAIRVSVARALAGFAGCSFGLFTPLKFLEEGAVRLVTLLTFRMVRDALLAAISILHLSSRS
jgi:hypothetical protein